MGFQIIGREPKAIAEDLEKLSEDAQANYRPDWTLNLEMAAGWLVEATRSTFRALVGSTLVESDTTDRYGEPCPVDIARPTLARFLSRHLVLMGGVQVLPRTCRREEKTQSEAAEKILEAKWDEGDLDVDCMQAFNIAACCSRGYVMVEGDDTLCPEQIADPDNPEKILERPLGDVVTSALTPFQVALLPGHSLRTTPVVQTKQFMDEMEIMRRWGPELKRLGAFEEDGFIRTLAPATYDFGNMDKLVPELSKSLYLVKRLFFAQDPVKCPKGRQVVFLGKHVIEVRDENGQSWMGTYNAGTPEHPKYEYPIVEFRDEPIYIGQHGRSRVTAARPQMKSLSACWSRVMHILCVPQILAVPEGCNFAKDLPDIPFWVVEYNAGGGRPEILAAQLVDHYFKGIDFATRCIEDVFSQHQPSKGVPSGSRFPAQGVQLLQQQDVLGDSAAGKMAIKAMRAVFRKVLGEGLRVWPDEYTAVVIGENQQAERYTLRKKVLMPGVDVQIVPGKEPRTRNALMRDLNQAVQYGVIPPPEARKLMGHPLKEDLVDPMRPYMDQIKAEELAFEQGETPEVKWWDPHPLHIQEHERSAAERYAEAEPPEDAARKAHVLLHIEADKPRMMAEAQAKGGMAPPQQQPEAPAAEGVPPEQPVPTVPESEIQEMP